MLCQEIQMQIGFQWMTYFSLTLFESLKAAWVFKSYLHAKILMMSTALTILGLVAKEVLF